MKAINRWISAKSAGLSIGKRGEFDNPPFDFAPTSSPFVEHIIDLLRAPPPSSSSFLFLSSRGLWTMVIFSWNKCSPFEVKTLRSKRDVFSIRGRMEIIGTIWSLLLEESKKNFGLQKVCLDRQPYELSNRIVKQERTGGGGEIF